MTIIKIKLHHNSEKNNWQIFPFLTSRKVQSRTLILIFFRIFLPFLLQYQNDWALYLRDATHTMQIYKSYNKIKNLHSKVAWALGLFARVGPEFGPTEVPALPLGIFMSKLNHARLKKYSFIHNQHWTEGEWQSLGAWNISNSTSV